MPGKENPRKGLPRDTAESVYAKTPRQGFADHAPGEYQATVEVARAAFARGDLFEAVPGQLFAEPCERSPAEVFQRLCRINPSPYGALMNLGDGEFLVSASPEMFVRSDGRRVETCPISGTIARGVDAIGDAEQIRQLLNSEKDEFELNMCTDVDRNDKARVCVPGTIKVLARRQIETYSKLFHTVDHVEGMLRPGFDALDAFLTHAWAVTVTGAPKLWAMQFVEDNERSSRRWYAGAIGAVNFDGSINTGLTIRTIRMKDGLAEVRVGATCLFDSDPAAEDRECQVKAAALFQALRGDAPKPLSAFAPDATGSGRKVLLIDHDDSFVHMLADYFRQVGASVTVVRHVHAQEMLKKNWDLLVLSPGPGRPEDFGISKTIGTALDGKLPIFGVCLGVQAIGEYFGGQLGQLTHPAHGRPSRIQVRGGRLMQNLPNEIVIGRYHSLYVERDSVPEVLEVTATTEDGVAMAIEHKTLPVGGVQFHPESLMSLGGEVGLRIVENAFRLKEPSIEDIRHCRRQARCVAQGAKRRSNPIRFAAHGLLASLEYGRKLKDTDDIRSRSEGYRPHHSGLPEEGHPVPRHHDPAGGCARLPPRGRRTGAALGGIEDRQGRRHRGEGIHPRRRGGASGLRRLRADPQERQAAAHHGADRLFAGIRPR